MCLDWRFDIDWWRWSLLGSSHDFGIRNLVNKLIFSRNDSGKKFIINLFPLFLFDSSLNRNYRIISLIHSNTVDCDIGDK